MSRFDRVVFVSSGGICRAPMAEGILKEYLLDDSIKVESRGMVVLFPQPLNQKAEAILAGNGITMKDFEPKQLEEEDFGEGTLILTMDSDLINKIIEKFENPINVAVLNEYVGDELEIINPYGQSLQAYGLCYETLSKSIRKLLELLNREEEDADE